MTNKPRLFDLATQAEDRELSAMAAMRNRLLAAAAGLFVLSFSALQVPKALDTPGLTDPWPWLITALALGLGDAVMEVTDARITSHAMGKGNLEEKTWFSPERVLRLMHAIHILRVLLLAAFAAAVGYSIFLLADFGAHVVARATSNAASCSC